MPVDTAPDFERLLTAEPGSLTKDDVIVHLRTVLLSGEVASAAKLPSERELSRLLGVGRTTVREALRTLEAQGLIEIKLGGHGGAFFISPDPRLVGSALAMLLLFDSATESDLSDFRYAFEQENAELAAERATDADRTRLRGLALRAASITSTDQQQFWRAIEAIDLELHELLPALTHNSVRIAISHGIHDALLRSFASIETPPDTPEILQAEVLELLDLVICGDATGARKAMAAHLARWRR